jgi:signal peptidase I
MTLTLTELVQQHPGEPTPRAVTRRWAAARVLLAVGALTYLVALAVLLAWSVLPVLLGWSSYVVQSGSMMPSIRPGDVLVSGPVGEGAPLRRGQIVVVDDPAVPGRLLSHRVARIRDDGFVITWGDANAQPDSTPVPPEAVRGRGRLLVPYVGLPQHWLVSGDYTRLVAWLTLTGLALAAVATDPSRQRRPGPPRHRGASSGRRSGKGLREAPSRTVRVDLAARLGLTTRAVTAVALGGVAVTTVTATAAQDDHFVGATFRNSTANLGNAFAALPDFVAPDASAVTVYKTKGYLTGSVRPTGPYRVFANVTDTGNPASGTASVRADTSQLTSGATATTLAGGSSTVGGTAYNYSSPVGSPLTVGSVGNGSKPWTLTMADVAGFSRTRSYTVTVDGTAPRATDVQATNTSGGTAGKPESGDTFTYAFSERIDPYSILDGWTGAPRSVYLIIQRTAPNNTITVYDGSATLPLGQVVTDRDRYVEAGTPYVWFAATMTQSDNVISLVLGAVSDGAAVKSVTDTTVSPLTWTPSGTPYDAAGNPMASTAAVTEGGVADLDF